VIVNGAPSVEGGSYILFQTLICLALQLIDSSGGAPKSKKKLPNRAATHADSEVITRVWLAG